VRYQELLDQQNTEEDAFEASTNAITGIISNSISLYGLHGAYEQLSGENQAAFQRGFDRSYGNSLRVVQDIYTEVVSGREVEEVIDKTKQLADKTLVWSELEKTPMWAMAKKKQLYKEPIEESKDEEKVRVDEEIAAMNEETAETMGMYVAMMMAQVNHLGTRGHKISEIINESLIEAIDSLNPFMAKDGVASMIDGCSTTARLGARKWGPVFMDALRARAEGDSTAFDAFMANDDLRADIMTCFDYRPPVKLVA